MNFTKHKFNQQQSTTLGTRNNYISPSETLKNRKPQYSEQTLLHNAIIIKKTN